MKIDGKLHSALMLRANSILEVVIAMSLIATAITLSTTIYINTIQSNQSLAEINEIGLVKSKLINQLINNDLKWSNEIDYNKVKLIIAVENTGNYQHTFYQLSNNKGVSRWVIENYSANESLEYE